MIKHQLWHKTTKSLSLSSHRCIKCKLVFKIKHISVQQARLAACGQSQVPYIGFSKNFCPALNDIIFKLLVLTMNKIDFLSKAVNVKTAFLYGQLEEEIYLKSPPSMKDISRDDCVVLKKFIYALYTQKNNTKRIH